MTYIQERGSTHVYHVNRMSKEEMDHMISICVHDQPAYCVAACPFKVDTKEMLFYASKGNFKKALAIYEKITPFPMILCDGCTAPCEDKCKLCELGDGISIREVERAIVRYGESSKRSSVFRMRKKKKAAICFRCSKTTRSYAKTRRPAMRRMPLRAWSVPCRIFPAS